MNETSVNRLKDQIIINVASEFLSEHSIPEANRYVFAYHITIENHGAQAVQLLSRHWIISDGNQKTEEVKGDGVIGEQPIIGPGETFDYSSGVALETPVGSMRGSYHMISTELNQPFSVTIPQFELIYKQAIH